HLELETGMNRLGFSISEIENVSSYIKQSGSFHVVSVFSHLAASDDESQDAFTGKQAAIFEEAVSIIKKQIEYPFLEHISNSAAIVRHPHLQKHMVRLGIGLYGIEIDNSNMLNLQAVATLRSTIAQLRTVKKGESVSYNRKGIVQRDSLIATVRIGYADGYSRHFSNGAGKMMVAGKLVPVTGVVCMDMTMIDVTGIPGVKEGDDVIIFGPELPVQDVAQWAGTIPYELMTAVSQRVKRVYFHE
ncbi:MAG TPA: alanine racemase, partial [Flavisolibacter sp.]